MVLSSGNQSNTAVAGMGGNAPTISGDLHMDVLGRRRPQAFLKYQGTQEERLDRIEDLLRQVLTNQLSGAMGRSSQRAPAELPVPLHTPSTQAETFQLNGNQKMRNYKNHNARLLASEIWGITEEEVTNEILIKAILLRHTMAQVPNDLPNERWWPEFDRRLIAYPKLACVHENMNPEDSNRIQAQIDAIVNTDQLIYTKTGKVKKEYNSSRKQKLDTQEPLDVDGMEPETVEEELHQTDGSAVEGIATATSTGVPGLTSGLGGAGGGDKNLEQPLLGGLGNLELEQAMGRFKEQQQVLGLGEQQQQAIGVGDGQEQAMAVGEELAGEGQEQAMDVGAAFCLQAVQLRDQMRVGNQVTRGWILTTIGITESFALLAVLAWALFVIFEESELSTDVVIA
ncbi:hypothetical protein M427DRAFT_50002 [Gonapodya prolifera JEL478]|uniref:Uncharacterized protein n=1 Tax=Gonapodya prolifera (strain JEL478) TaxID=1344416 RepID=A0A138ZY91_GONPJ|nr:hypothetical protein M427DRAFT_50002 [Gonapodya prolifera JEL478]|eukprot:KXS09093.1 hypothetical protein M427DRAFT_50002 [Gonapodya prolifera JEL478]